jgi:hypothetical protein
MICYLANWTRPVFLVSAGRFTRMRSQEGEEEGSGEATRAERIACFLHHYARVAASPFPILSGDQ